MCIRDSVSIEASVWKDTAYKLTEKTADGYSIYQVKILDSDQERVLDLRNLSAYYDISLSLIHIWKSKLAELTSVVLLVITPVKFKIKGMLMIVKILNSSHLQAV